MKKQKYLFDGETYLNPLTDFGFKHLFGQEQNKELLIHFLNSLLSKIDIQITSIDFKKTEFLGRSAKHKTAIFDLFCVTSDAQDIIIEVQRSKQKYIFDRSIYYVSHLIVNQPKAQRWDYKITPVIIISLLDFELSETLGEHVVSTFRLRSGELPSKEHKALNWIFVQLGRFKKSIDDTDEILDQWLYILKNLNKLDKLPLQLNEPVFSTLFKKAELGKLNESQMMLYDRELSILRDEYSRMKTAQEDNEEAVRKSMEKGMQKGMEKGMQKGMEKGLQEGLEQGLKKGVDKGAEQTKQKYVIKLYTEGFTEEKIATLFEIELEEVRNILGKG